MATRRQLPRSSLLYIAATPVPQERATEKITASGILGSPQKIKDQYCGYCLGENKVTKSFYRTRYNVPLCRDWATKGSHKMYVLHTPIEIVASTGRSGN